MQVNCNLQFDGALIVSRFVGYIYTSPQSIRMSTNHPCRFAVHVGLTTISYAKIAHIGNNWRLVSSGLLPLQNLIANPDAARRALHATLQTLVKQEGISREAIHVSLHNRMCITRVVTGNRQQVEAQQAEIAENSQHYLQLGLGEKLIGHTTVPIDESRQHGQVAIIKRGVIETIDGAIGQVGLQLASLDGALTCVCRLAGVAEIDRSPLLLIWLGSTGAEIGISYKGRLQLNYHSRECTDLETTAATIGKHLKRLRRFCDRYRQVEGQSDLKRVLVLTPNGEAERFRGLLEKYDFEHIYTLDDLAATPLGQKLGGQSLYSAGAASALGGLLVHLEPNMLPATNVYQKYLSSKPRSLSKIVFRDGWPLLASAAMLLCMLGGSWLLGHLVRSGEAQNDSLVSNFDLERQQLLELDRLRKVLREYERLEEKVTSHSIRDIVTRVAQCLPEECRLDWCGFDSQSVLVLKGTMLQGDQTYEILKALRDLPVISEVSLESVGNSSNQGKNATLFEIHCAIAAQPAKSTKPAASVAQATRLTASRGTEPR